MQVPGQLQRLILALRYDDAQSTIQGRVCLRIRDTLHAALHDRTEDSYFEQSKG